MMVTKNKDQWALGPTHRLEETECHEKGCRKIVKYLPPIYGQILCDDHRNDARWDDEHKGG
jgi:hypothetical protein